MTLFEDLLGRHELERHAGIFGAVARARRARLRRRPDPNDGFMPLSEAAALMQVDQSVIAEMIGRQEIEVDFRAAGIWVRPAVVSRLGVRTT